MSRGAILIVPAVERGRGGGHISRSLFLLQRLKELGREAYLWIPGDQSVKEDVLNRFRGFFQGFNALLSDREELRNRAWDFIVLDRFKTPAEEFAFWSGLGPLIGIDEGGKCRSRFDFLIDLLPGLNPLKPNLSAPGLLPLPKKRRPSAAAESSKDNPLTEVSGAENVFRKSRPLRVLISFGAEDVAGLGVSAARALFEKARDAAPEAAPEAELEITLIVSERDKLGDTERELPGIKITGPFPGLKEQLAEYDLFITHFGLGAFEAVYARVSALLLSPTAYHEKLSRNAGFFSFGCGTEAVRRLRACSFGPAFLETLEKQRREIARCFGLEEEQKEDLGSFINGLAVHSARACPVCVQTNSSFTTNQHEPTRTNALARFPEESYRRCKHCGAIYLSRLNPPPVEYKKDYFFDFYKKQYGKTYLEDFPNLKEMGRRRLKHIMALGHLLHKTSHGDMEEQRPQGGREEKSDFSSVNRPSLLDIGCAYGPFLAAAAECGFSPCGVDPAEDAVRYVNEELGFSAWRGVFPGALSLAGAAAGDGAESRPARFDIITLWYVIEHFEEPGMMLREINKLLKAGGILAFSTPSFSGISGRKSLYAFLKNSPPDHWTVWSPRTCRRIFKQYGFQLRKIVVTGHHPERFPLLGRFIDPAKKGLLYRLLLLVSRLFRLGDTFEAYGVKA